MKWEYLVERAISQMTLQNLGKDGWELVAVSDNVCYLKRQIVDVSTVLQLLNENT